MELTMKTLAQIQIAIKLDDYNYEKNTQGYFEKMPSIGLGESQLMYVNEYLEILENKDGSKREEFYRILNRIRNENNSYQELIKRGNKSSLIKKFASKTAYLVRQLEKYQKLY